MNTKLFTLALLLGAVGCLNASHVAAVKQAQAEREKEPAGVFALLRFEENMQIARAQLKAAEGREDELPELKLLRQVMSTLERTLEPGAQAALSGTVNTFNIRQDNQRRLRDERASRLRRKLLERTIDRANELELAIAARKDEKEQAAVLFGQVQAEVEEQPSLEELAAQERRKRDKRARQKEKKRAAAAETKDIK